MKNAYRIVLGEKELRDLINGKMVDIVTDTPEVRAKILLSDVGMDEILSIATLAYESFLAGKIDMAGTR